LLKAHANYGSASAASLHPDVWRTPKPGSVYGLGANVAPLPDNNTGRYFVDYLANGREHTVMFRYAAGAAPNAPGIAFLESCRAFLEEMAAAMPTDYAMVAARYSASGTNFTIPLAAPIVEAAGAVTPNLSDAPSYWNFIGRTLGGRQVKLMMLGVGDDASEPNAQGKNYRLTTAERPTVAAAVGVLNSSGQVAIDNLEPTWYTYVNLGYHSYWTRKLRQ
jgi:hypothetical protein